jgi:energy-converting hydrogenase Eha subunit B
MVVRVLFAVMLVLASRAAHADPSERSDRDRVWNVAPFAAGGAFYLVLEFGLKEKLSREECRWCRSNAFDTGMRSLGKWDNVERADFVSNLTGYVGAPVYGAGMLVLSSIDDADVRRWFDDIVPVMQAGIVTGVLNQTFKLLFVRRRPFAEFQGRSVQQRKGDVNTSFFSGHSGLAFAMAASAGTVASLRDYRSAPAIWAGGLMIAVTTGYLRIAADAHYTTDVLAGAVIGSAVGIAIPLLFHEDVLTDEEPVARLRSSKGMMISLGSWAF